MALSSSTGTSPDWNDITRVPSCLHPFMDEIEAFCNYLTQSVSRRLLTLFSRVLELPHDYLWEKVQSHGSPTGEGYFRHALFRPVEKETEDASKGPPHARPHRLWPDHPALLGSHLAVFRSGVAMRGGTTCPTIPDPRHQHRRHPGDRVRRPLQGDAPPRLQATGGSAARRAPVAGAVQQLRG